MLASDAYLYQRTKVHSHYMFHPYGTLSPRTRTRGSTHIITQCFSFGDIHLLPPSHHVLASDAYLYLRTEVHSHYMSHPYGTLSPRARTSGSTHIVTQCFSFGDIHLLPPSRHVQEPEARLI